MARYEIKEGDTLFKIAKRYADQPQLWREIKKANDGLKNKGLTVGDIIKIPEKILTKKGKAQLVEMTNARKAARKQAKRGQGMQRGPSITGPTPEEQALTFAEGALSSDPAYQAYVRWSELERARLEDDIIFQEDQFNQQINRRAAGFEDQKSEGNRDIGLAAEDRGFYKSGQRLRDQNVFSAQVDAARFEEEATARDALDESIRRQQQDINALTIDDTEEELKARERLAQEHLQRTI